MDAKTTDGFTRLPHWLLDDSDLELNELIVYVVLLRFRDNVTRKCFPGMATIADLSRLSKKSVQRAIKSLEDRRLIQVERRSTPSDTRPNIYTVAAPEQIRRGSVSARGTRIPTRKKRNASSSNSELTPSDSESTEAATPSPPNKNHKNKNHEQDMRSALTGRLDSDFSFDIPQKKATSEQLLYLHDLHIHFSNTVPAKTLVKQWEELNAQQASALISTYLRRIPRYQEYEGPEYDTPEYDALSDEGKRWADTGMIPDVFA